MYVIIDLNLEQANVLCKILNSVASNKRFTFKVGQAGDSQISILWNDKTFRIVINNPILAGTDFPKLTDDQIWWDPIAEDTKKTRSDPSKH